MIEQWREMRRRGPHPLTAAALSAVWPGLGHFRHNKRRALTLVIGTFSAAVLVLAFIAARGGTSLLTWTVTPSMLWIAIIGTVVVLVFRIAVAVDAYRAVRRLYKPQRRGIRRIAAMFALIVLVGIITMPHIFVIRYAVAQLGLLSDVFGATDTQTAVPTPVATTTVPTTAATGTTEIPIETGVPALVPADAAADATVPESSAPETSAAAATDPTAVAPETSAPADTAPATSAPADTAPAATAPATSAPAATAPATSTTTTTTTATTITTTTVPPRTWYGDERLTIALLGGDSGFDRSGVRTDTIILFSMDVATGDAAAFNIPRNWKDLPFPAGTTAAERWPDGYPGIANEIYGLGVRFPEAFPDTEDPSGYAVKSALAQITGLSVQYYVLVDMVGFVKAVDLLGGIDIHVTESIDDRIKPIERDGPSVDIVVEPGDHHFDGLTALGYVRSRVASSDYNRMTRQRCVIEALIDQSSYAEVIGNFLDLTRIISDHVNTDIPSDRLAELIILGSDLDTSRIATVNFIPPEFPTGSAPVDLVRAAVSQAIQGTADEGPEASLADRCRGSG